MAGVLDWFSNPANQGLLALSAGLLQAGGPQRFPVSFGQALGQGTEAGMGAFNQARQLNAMEAMRQAQMQLISAQVAKAQQDQQFSSQFLGKDLSTVTPAQLRAIGVRAGLAGHPGAATLINQAQHMEDAQREQAALGTLRSGPGILGAGVTTESPQGQALLSQAMTGDPEFDRAALTATNQSLNANAQPGMPAQGMQAPQAGLLGIAGRALTESPYVKDSIQQLQRQVDAGVITAKDARAELNRLSEMHSRLAEANAVATRRANERIDFRMMFPNPTDLGGSEKSPYANVQPDGKGGWVGINKKTGQMEQVPVAQGVSGAGQLTGDALDMAAERYLIDHSLPQNLGRGAQGAANTAAILNKAADVAKERGQTGEETAIRQVAGKATGQALAALSTQETKMRAFEGTLRKNADLALKLSDKVDRVGSPIVNKWIQAGKRSVAGDQDIVQLDVAVKSVVNEYAKIISNATGSGVTAEGEIKKIEGLLSSAQTKQQVKNVIEVIRKETDNRMKEFDEEKQRLKSSLASTSPQRRASDRPGAIINFNDLPQ